MTCLKEDGAGTKRFAKKILARRDEEHSSQRAEPSHHYRLSSNLAPLRLLDSTDASAS